MRPFLVHQVRHQFALVLSRKSAIPFIFISAYTDSHGHCPVNSRSVMHITRQKVITHCNHFIKHWSKTRCTLPSESVTHPENQWLHYEGSQPYPFSALTRLVADSRPSAASWLPSLLKGPTQMACWAWHAYKGSSLKSLDASRLIKAFIAKPSNSPVPWTPKSSLKPPQAAGLYLALCACVWAPRVLHVCEHHGQRQGQLEKSVSQLACFYVWECMWTYEM